MDKQGISRVDDGRVTQRLSWAELSEVAIRTTPDGPVRQDAYWILKRHGREAMVVPDEAARQIGLLEQLQTLPKFDTAMALEAAASSHDEVFVCWRVNEGG